MKPFFSLGSLIVLTILLLPGCTNDPTPAVVVDSSNQSEALDDVRGRLYRYTGFSRDGAAVVRGYLRLARNDSGDVVGGWHLRAVTDSNRIGPQHGHGRLVGQLRDNGLHIDLNPQNVDNNVILSGHLRRNVYAGRWQWIGFAGVLNSGTFHAVLATDHESQTD